MIDTAVILAGGKGTRLKSVTGDIPKPLVDFGGEPLLAFQIRHLKNQGIKNLIITVGYGADMIMDFCQQNNDFGINITYIHEDEPLGTAGAVIANLKTLPNEFFVVYSDTVLGVDFNKFYHFHHNNSASATVFLAPTDHPEDSDLFELDDAGLLSAIHPAPHAQDYPNLSNQALYIMTRADMEKLTFSKNNMDFVKDIFTQYLQKNIPIQGYVCYDYIKDLGTHQRYLDVLQDLQEGKITHA